MARNKLNKLDKITFVIWVDKALDQSLTKQNIKVGFNVTWIWPFNLRTMDEKIELANIYTTINSIYEEGENHYTIEENHGHNQQDEEYVIVELLNIIGLVAESTTDYYQEEHEHYYYLKMPRNLIVTYDTEEHVINLDDSNYNL